MVVKLPCKIGDTMWGIVRRKSVHIAKSGIVSTIFFMDDMQPVICIKGICQGLYGEKIFQTREAAEKKIEEVQV